MPEINTLEPVVKFHRALKTHDHDDLLQHVQLARALYVSALATPAQRTAELAEAAALIDGLPRMMRRQTSVALWRDRIAEEQKKRRLVWPARGPLTLRPLSGTVEFVRHHPGRGRNVDMGVMHRRVLARRGPYYAGSEHLVQNERTVTKINGTLKGAPAACYVVQIAAKTVAGIDSYVKTGDDVERGAIFGMIRIGSQVDIVVPWREDLRVWVEPGDRVRAGETLLVD